MPNVICNACNEEIYELVNEIHWWGICESSDFKSLHPDQYPDPVNFERMDCPKCSRPFPMGGPLLIKTTDGILPKSPNDRSHH